MTTLITAAKETIHIGVRLTMYSRDLKLIKLTFKSTASLVRRTISYGSSPLFEGEGSDLK